MIDKFLMSRTPDAQPQCEQKIKRERARQQGESARMGKSILVNENDIYRHIDAIIIFYAVGKETIERRIDNDIGISLSNCFVFYFLFWLAVAVAIWLVCSHSIFYCRGRSLVYGFIAIVIYLLSHTGTQAHTMGTGSECNKYTAARICVHSTIKQKNQSKYRIGSLAIHSTTYTK